jgi:hypothetical protein
MNSRNWTYAPEYLTNQDFAKKPTARQFRLHAQVVKQGWFCSALENMKRKRHKRIKLPIEEIRRFFTRTLTLQAVGY